MYQVTSARPRAVIFDCDGVLVDSEKPMHEVLALELAARGLKMSKQDCLQAFMGKSIEDVIATARAMGADLPANWRQLLYEKVHARLNEGVDLIPGVRDLIERLKASAIPFCIASNGSERKVELMLSQHGLWESFKGRCFSAQTLGVAKPDPGLLNHALVHLGQAATDVVVIEDSLTGLQSAHNAGVPCLLYDPQDLIDIGSGNVPELAPEHKFRHMSEIAEHILA